MVDSYKDTFVRGVIFSFCPVNLYSMCTITAILCVDLCRERHQLVKVLSWYGCNIVCKLSYYILSKDKGIWLKQLIWEDPTGTMVSVGLICWNNGVSRTMVLIVRDMILW